MGEITDILSKEKNKDKSIFDSRDIRGGSITDRIGIRESKLDTNLTPEILEEGKLEDYRAERQSAWDTLGNTLGQFVGLTAARVARTPFDLIALLYAGGEALATDTGFGESLSDNPLTKTFDEIEQNIITGLQNYQTDEYQNAGLLSTLGSSEFWAEAVGNGGSYALSSYLTGRGISSLIGAGAKLNKPLLSAANNLGDDVVNSIKGYTATENVIYNGGRQIAASTIGALTEATTEATSNMQQARDKMRNDLLAKREAETGVAILTPEDEQQIEEKVNQIGNAVFATNLALLSVSNLVQFGKYFGNYSDDLTELGKAIKGEAGEGLIKRYTPEQIKEATEWYKKLYSNVKKVTPNLVDAGIEGLEETAQGAISSLFENYYGTDNKVAGNLTASFAKVKEDIFSTDGLHSFLSGAIIGGITTGAKNILDKNKETREQKINNAVEQLNNINLSSSLRNIADELSKKAYINQGKVGSLIEGDDITYEMLNNLDFANDVITATKYGKFQDILEQLDNFENTPIEEVKQMVKGDLTIDESNDKIDVEAIGKIDRKKLAKTLRERALGISKEYQELKRKYGHVYDDKELGYIATLNSTRDMLVQDRNKQLDVLEKLGFKYRDAILRNQLNPQTLEVLEKRKSENAKRKSDIENELFNFQNLTTDQRATSVDFKRLTDELNVVNNEAIKILEDIDSTILVGENENNFDDFSNRVNEAFNRSMNQSEFEKIRQAGDVRKQEEIKQALKRTKKYNSLITEYANLYNKYTSEDGKKQLKDFFNRVEKIKKDKETRNLFTTKIRNKDGELIDSEIKTGLYSKPMGKAIQLTDKGKPKLDEKGNPIWGGKSYDRLYEVVGRETIIDKNGRIKPIVKVKDEDGQIVDYDLDDFRDLRKVKNDYLDDETRFILKHKTDLIRYKYRENPGEPTKDIYGFVERNQIGGLRLMYFDETTGETKYTKPIYSKEGFKQGEAFKVYSDNADYNQYLEVMSDDFKNDYLLKISQKLLESKLERDVEKWQRRANNANLDAYDNVVGTMANTETLDELQKEVIRLETLLAKSINEYELSQNDKDSLLDVIYNVNQELVEKENSLERRLEDRKLSDKLNNINKIRLQQSIDNYTQAKLRYEVIKKNQSDKDNFDNGSLYQAERELENAKLVLLNNYNTVKDAEVSSREKALDIHKSIVDKTFQYNTDSRDILISAVQDGYLNPEQIEKFNSQTLTPNTKLALLKYTIQKYSIDKSAKDKLTKTFNVDLENITETGLNKDISNLLDIASNYRDNKNQIHDEFVERLTRGFVNNNPTTKLEELSINKYAIDLSSIISQHRAIEKALKSKTERNLPYEYEMNRAKWSMKNRQNDLYTRENSFIPSEESATPDASIPNAGIKTISFTGSLNDRNFDAMKIEDKYEFVANQFFQNTNNFDNYEFVYLTEDVKADGIETLPYDAYTQNEDTQTIYMVLRDKKTGRYVTVDSNGVIKSNGKYAVVQTLAAATPQTISRPNKPARNRFRQQYEIEKLKQKLSETTDEATKLRINNEIDSLQQLINLRVNEILEHRRKIFDLLKQNKVVTSSITSKSNGILRVDGNKRKLSDVLKMSDDVIIDEIIKGNIELKVPNSDILQVNDNIYKVKKGHAYIIHNNKIFYMGVNKLNNYDVEDIISGLKSVLKGTRTYTEVLNNELSVIYWGKGSNKKQSINDEFVDLKEDEGDTQEEIRAKTYRLYVKDNTIVYGKLKENLSEQDYIDMLVEGKDRFYEDKEISLSDLQDSSEKYYDFREFLSSLNYNVNSSILNSKTKPKKYITKLVKNALNTNMRPNGTIQFDSIYMNLGVAEESNIKSNVKPTTTVTNTGNTTNTDIDKTVQSKFGYSNLDVKLSDILKEENIISQLEIENDMFVESKVTNNNLKTYINGFNSFIVNKDMLGEDTEGLADELLQMINTYYSSASTQSNLQNEVDNKTENNNLDLSNQSLSNMFDTLNANFDKLTDTELKRVANEIAPIIADVENEEFEPNDRAEAIKFNKRINEKLKAKVIKVPDVSDDKESANSEYSSSLEAALMSRDDKSKLEQIGIESLGFTPENNTIKLKDGNTYLLKDVDINLLSSLGYDKKDIGTLLKSIC